ncbi:MAG TPA: hypothetical protein VFE62_17920, partial [Gemmataceae bacterium]|nr:hypothetical protein [Gemmataceae bacterium]
MDGWSPMDSRSAMNRGRPVPTAVLRECWTGDQQDAAQNDRCNQLGKHHSALQNGGELEQAKCA